jgi:hypothetical protein
MVSDVAVDPNSPYEDWWVHPDYANTQGMRSGNGVNFAWDYMMEKL